MAAAMTKATGTSHNQDSKGKRKRKKCTNYKRQVMERKTALKRAEVKLTIHQIGGKKKWKN